MSTRKGCGCAAIASRTTDRGEGYKRVGSGRTQDWSKRIETCNLPVQFRKGEEMGWDVDD